MSTVAPCENPPMAARSVPAAAKKPGARPPGKPFARHLKRVRAICLGLPDTFEKLSHGEPTFFVKNGVFAACSNNHHNDGHVAVLLPAAPGLQEAMVADAPEVYYRPPYVGGAGWIGVELDRVDDETLDALIRQAWQLIVSKKRRKR